jgi:hypothetical protein
MAENDPEEQKEPEESKPTQEPVESEGEGEEHEVHREILERRMRGGPKPTRQSYERALEQWKKIPGSVVRPPTDTRRPPEESSEEGNTKSETDENNEEEKP